MGEIVKIQVPLSADDGPWLIYDHDRKHMETRDAAKIGADLKAAMRGDPKGYFLAVWSDSGWIVGDPQ